MMKYLDYLLRGIVAVILLQTLWFKFSAAPESVAIFSALHVEPWGRYVAAVTELTASILLAIPRTVVFGAALAAGTMFGAIAAHIFVIGIAVQGDGGLLFALACLVAMASLICLYIRRDEAGHAFSRLTRYPLK